ncbi:hypothetical protein [Flavihumibacter petaseus]|uniref:Uncharacterized protein n=1 Tax=Flavihumibacter petaseus NBRC 106054 TaxID=1220578 RepID=A0A0E9N1Z9_9BACT|nr:hypothetical protein [Flavihumibacter petaseus]GAO43818.1 hypothetical protein FPE01S_02_09240 [Flavihumibacter petaseus NBRC 106054]
MATITFLSAEKSLKVNADKLVGVSTQSLYIRKGHLSGALFVSQKRTGGEGAGDICRLVDGEIVTVGANLFARLMIYADKAGAVIN